MNWPMATWNGEILHASTDDISVEEILKLANDRADTKGIPGPTLAQAVAITDAAKRGRRVECHYDSLLFGACPDGPPGLYIQIPFGELEEREQFVALGFAQHASWPIGTDSDLAQTMLRGMF